MQGKRFQASQAHRLDDPARKTWLPPVEILNALNLRAGDTIADAGCGTGYFSLPMAEAVGLKGKVYAIDAQAEMLTLLRQKLEQPAITNVELIHAEADQTGLRSASCDLFFLANIWHEIENRMAVLAESLRVLKADGRIVILDWRPDVEPEQGPPLAHRIEASSGVESLRNAGFKQITIGEAGKYSWLVQGVKVQ